MLGSESDDGVTVVLYVLLPYGLPYGPAGTCLLQPPQRRIRYLPHLDCTCTVRP